MWNTNGIHDPVGLIRYSQWLQREDIVHGGTIGPIVDHAAANTTKP